VPHIDIFELQPSSPEIETCAKWRVEAFSDVIEGSAEEERRTLTEFTRNRAAGLALMAKFDGVLAGTCLLVPRELEPCHPVSPWLAGLYVDPEFRRHGVGRRLVRAIEDEARLRGNDHLYLYTDSAIGYYERQGWIVQDKFDWKGIPTTLMVRHLRP
jgi:GNAT superfamily N-acetyltransferase